MKLVWSCDERDRANCRNAHGCHCHEITVLIAQLKDVTATLRTCAEEARRLRKQAAGRCTASHPSTERS